MKCKFKKVLTLILAAMMLLSLLGGCATSGYEEVSTYTYEEATKELEAKLKKITVTEMPATMDIYSLDTVSAALADIDTFTLTVEGRGQIDIEIAAPSELSGETPDDLINVLAKKFNNARYEVNGKTVSVSVRKIASGEVVTYMTEGDYRPDMYIPSSFALGEMLKAKGIGVVKLADRIAGNTAGVLMEKNTYAAFTEKYGEPTVAKVLEASLAGDITFAYTNPYTSATGLNILTTMLYSFDPDNPLSDAAAQKLLDYQKQSPPVAYTTGVMRTQAAKGIIKAMVMEEQACINTPELKDYVYFPDGIRHDHPVYTFDYVSAEKQEVAKLFTEYCLSNEAQKLATEKGFNRHDDYVSRNVNLDGAGYLAAQKIWKANKDGGRPIIAVFIADVSGSMDGDRLNALKESLIAASGYISSDHYIGLISYSDNVYVNLPIEQFDNEQRAYFRGAVNGLTTVNSTATFDAVLVGLDMIRKKALEVPDAKLMLFLLSDGERNCGYGFNDVSNIVGGMRVPIYSIGYNMKDAGNLQRLSEINEAALINAQTDDIINQLRNLFNVQL